MYAQVDKLKENKSRVVANSVAQKKRDVKQYSEFTDNRTETCIFKNLSDHSTIANTESVIQAVFNYNEDVQGEWATQLGEVDAEQVASRVRLLHDTLIANNDVANVHRAIGAYLQNVTLQDVQRVKDYNFDSHAILFTVENYEAWTRLSNNIGTVNDLRYIKHELHELGFLANDGQGVNFLCDESWNDQMEENFEQRYQLAHYDAIGDEVRNLAEMLNGELDVTPVTWQQVAVVSPKEDYHVYYAENTGVIQLPDRNDDGYFDAIELAREQAIINLAVPEDLADRLAALLERAL